MSFDYTHNPNATETLIG